MALTLEQKERLGILPQQLIEYELGQIEWYREQIIWSDKMALKYPDYTDQFVESIKIYKGLIMLSSQRIAKEMDQ